MRKQGEDIRKGEERRVCDIRAKGTNPMSLGDDTSWLPSGLVVFCAHVNTHTHTHHTHTHTHICDEASRK